MSQENPNAQTQGTGAPASQPGQVQSYAHVQQAVAQQPDKVKRFLAYFIDGIILGVISQITIVGALAAVAGWLLRDVVWEGNSVGKKLLGLRAVTAAGAPLTLNDSIRRNAIFAVGAVGTVLANFGLGGALLALPLAFGGAALAIIEGILVLTDQPRLGDRFAATKVVTEQPQAVVAR